VRPVGVSTGWHWPESMGWPFAAAVEAGVAYWSNQVNGTGWASYTDYRRLYDARVGGKPDYISLSANRPTVGCKASDGGWAIDQGAPEVAVVWGAVGRGGTRRRAAGLPPLGSLPSAAPARRLTLTGFLPASNGASRSMALS